ITEMYPEGTWQRTAYDDYVRLLLDEELTFCMCATKGFKANNQVYVFVDSGNFSGPRHIRALADSLADYIPKAHSLGPNAECHENIACSVLAQQLPNLTLIVVDSQPTVVKMWEAVVKEYTYKGAFSQTRMRKAFLSTRCPRGGDVCNFLADLHVCRAELDAVSVGINDDDYQSTILQSLPLSLSNFTSMQLSAAHLNVAYGGSGTIDLDLLIIMVSDEWEQTQTYSHSCRKDDVPVYDALSVEGNGKEKGKGKKKGPCWKCGGLHMKRECPELEGEEENKSRAKSESSKWGKSANVMATTWDNNDVAFTVEVIDDDFLAVDDIGGCSNRFEVELEVDSDWEAQPIVHMVGTSEIKDEKDFFSEDEGEFTGEPDSAWELSVRDDGGNWEVCDTFTLGLQAQVADNISSGVFSGYHVIPPELKSLY
ncbi:hypothetical protein AN958_01725, partial [Leucoagaricus sp. SymC.cos]